MYRQQLKTITTFQKMKTPPVSFKITVDLKRIHFINRRFFQSCLLPSSTPNPNKKSSYQGPADKFLITNYHESLPGLKKNGILQKSSSCPSFQSVRCFSELPIQQAPIVQVDGFMKVLVDSAPVEFCQNSLLWLHSSTGLPWWATVVLTTCALRTLVTVPCAIYQHNNFAKLALLKYDMEDVIKDLKREANFRVQHLGWTETRSRNMYNRSVKKEWDKLVIRDNCHPAKGLILVLTQLPLWIVLSAGLRNLCFMLPAPTPLAVHTYQALSVEGFGWITNLVAVDGYWILPVSLGIMNLINIEMQAMLRVTEPSKLQMISLNIFRGLSLLMVPLAGVVPSCLSLYWATSSAFSIVQSLLIVSPRVRRTFKIPVTDNDLDHPYQLLLHRLKQRFTFKNLKSS